MVTCNTESFRNLVTDVFVQLNEIEIQLSGLEAWAGLPPECFSPTSASSSMPFDADQISAEAQTLVEVVRQLQLGLHSMVSKPSSQSLSITSANAVSSSVTPSKSSVAASQSRGIPTPVYGGAHVTPSYSATPVVAPCSISSTHVDASPQIQDCGSYANFAYKSPCAVSGSGSIQSQSTSGLYPSPSMHMSTDTFTQPPSASRQSGSSCPDPNFTISASNMRADYHSHIQQVVSTPDQQLGPSA
ncbi:unnamed protein product [Dicrocoelium dendriticum]|nr:unnamed protein product [Dicrocoelium dendriticum]